MIKKSTQHTRRRILRALFDQETRLLVRLNKVRATRAKLGKEYWKAEGFLFPPSEHALRRDVFKEETVK